MPTYTVRALPYDRRPTDWNDPVWASANELLIGIFYAQGSDHQPRTTARMLYNASHLYVRFAVQDRYVKATNVGFQSMVRNDSCVEVFLRPHADAPAPHNGYINFETSCGGSLHCSYIEDARRRPGGFEKFVSIPPEIGSRVQALHSLPQRVDPEIAEYTEWFIQLAIPFEVFEHYVGSVRPLSGTRWLGNLYKCGDKTSHPHWASWAHVGEKLNFHQPESFAPIAFE